MTRGRVVGYSWEEDAHWVKLADGTCLLLNLRFNGLKGADEVSNDALVGRTVQWERETARLHYAEGAVLEPTP